MATDDVPLSNRTNMLTSTASESTVTSRLYVRRLERHNTALREMRLEMEVLQEHTNAQFRETADDCRSRLVADTASLEQLMYPLEQNATLIPLDVLDLETLWDDVDAMLRQRVGVITEMMSALKTIENDRKERIGDVIRVHGKVLQSISFLLPPDVDRLLFHEAQTVNESLLSNRVGLANIRARLLTNEVMLARRLRQSWEVKQKLWAQLRLSLALDTLKQKITSSESYDLERKRILTTLFATDADNHQKQRALITAASRLAPENMNDMEDISAKIAAWREDVEFVLQSGNEDRGKFVALLQMETESSEIELYGQVSATKIELVRTGVVVASDVHQVVDAQISQLLEQQLGDQADFIEPLHTALVKQATHAQALVEGVCLEVETQHSLWKQFHENQHELEHSLQQRLDECSSTHAEVVLEINEQIDCVIDSTRNAEDPKALESEFEKVLTNMSDVTNQWEVYNSQSIAIISEFDKMLKDLIATHFDDVETHVGGCREVLKTNNQQRQQQQQQQQLGADTTQGELDLVSLGDHHVSVETILPVCYDKLWQGWLSHVSNSDAHVNVHVAEVKATLDAKMEISRRLHEDKLKRLRADVYNVRKAELAFHRDRVCRHARAMETALTHALEAFDNFRVDVDEKSVVFVQQFETFVSKLPTVDHVTSLTTLRTDAKTLCTCYQGEVQDRIRSYRKALDATVREYRESNGALRTSFRTFSEGGNFSSVEIEEFTCVLKALEQRIHDTETKIHTPLNEIGTTEAADTDHRYKTFENQFELYLADVTVYQEGKRWIRNAQIHVRSHVAACNAQSRSLDDALSSLALLEVDESNFNVVCENLKTIISLSHDRARMLGVPLLNTLTTDSPEDRCTATRATKLKATPPPDVAVESTTKRRSKKFAKFTPKWAEWTIHDEGDFLSMIHELRCVCRSEVWRDLARPYYDALHGRALVRADLLEETPQGYIVWLETKLTDMFVKAEEYTKQSVSEFQDQLQQALALFKKIVATYFESTRSKIQQSLQRTCDEEKAKAADVERVWLTQGNTIMAKLRPVLGHPQNATELAQLQDEEEARHNGIMNAFDAARENISHLIQTQTTFLSEKFGKAKQALLVVLDNAVLPTVDITQQQHQQQCQQQQQQQQQHDDGDENNTIKNDNANVITATIQQSFDSQVAIFTAACADLSKFQTSEEVQHMMQASQHEWAAAIAAIKSLYV